MNGTGMYIISYIHSLIEWKQPKSDGHDIAGTRLNVPSFSLNTRPFSVVYRAITPRLRRLLGNIRFIFFVCFLCPVFFQFDCFAFAVYPAFSYESVKYALALYTSIAWLPGIDWWQSQNLWQMLNYDHVDMNVPLILIGRSVLLQLECSSALDRIKEGRPMMIKYDKTNTDRCIADIVSVGFRYITTIDMYVYTSLPDIVPHPHAHLTVFDKFYLSFLLFFVSWRGGIYLVNLDPPHG